MKSASKIATMVAKAAQTYGFIVTDRAGTVAIQAEDPAPVQVETGVDPWKSHMESLRPYQVLAGFPWEKLQALPKDYGKPWKSKDALRNVR